MKLVCIIAGFVSSLTFACAAVAATPSLPHPVRFVVGNDVWQPGRQYRNGDDWLGLACTAAGCRLVPARLGVLPESWQGHYDERPTRGQKLHFAPSEKTAGKIIAWFQRHSTQPWLAPGTVTTYASAARRLKRPPSEGTFEVAVDLPDGSMATFVPLLDREARTFRLQLRAHGRRQTLGELAGCSHVVSTQYFLWAGDLDRDGRPDYLVSFVDSDGQVLLYLSSMAARKEIAGVGGVYDAPPFGGECDDAGWLPSEP